MMPVIFDDQFVFGKTFFRRLFFNCARQIMPGQFTRSEIKFALAHGAGPLVLQCAPRQLSKLG